MKRTGTGTLAALAAAVAFLLYGMTLAPTLAAGDSGELALAAGRLAIPHPPGYPVWVIAAWSFVHLPFLSSLGDLAFRANLFSAVCTALAVAGTVIAGRWLNLSRPAALLAAGVVATLPAVWSFSTVAEVYALNLLLIAAATLAFIRYRRKASAGNGLLLGIATGLLLLHHQSNVLVLPLLVAGVLRRPATSGAPGAHGTALIAGLALGLAPALWTPLRAALRPDLDWFGAGSAAHLASNWFRGFYGPLRQNPVDAGLLVEQARAAVTLLIRDFGPVLLPAGLGLWFLYRRRRISVMLAATAAVLLPIAGTFAVLNARPDAAHLHSLKAFWYPAFLALAMLAGFGLDAARAIITERSGAGRSLRAAGAVAATTVTLLIAFQVARFYPECDRSQDHVAEHYGLDLLVSLPEGARLLVDGDNELFLTAYLQRERHVREDVTIHHTKGIFSAREAGRAISDEALARGTAAPIYCTTLPDWARDRGFIARREGLVWRVASEDQVAQLGPAPWPWPLYADVRNVDPARLDYPTRKCLVAYYQAWAETMTSRGRTAEAREAWLEALEIGHDFPEAGALLASLETSEPGGLR